MSCIIENIEFNNDKNVVYGLLSPFTKEIRYIGKAVNLKRRFKKHLQTSNLIQKTHKNNWINELINLGEKPLIVVLESCSIEQDLNDIEIKWINHYKKIGCRLTNGTEGGDGGKMSAESIQKMKQTKLENKQIPHWLGKKFSKEHSKNISEGKKGYITSEETKVKLSESHKGINTWSKGIKLSEETKEKMSKCRLGKPKNEKPVYQLDLNGNIIKLWDSPYYAEKHFKLSRSKINEVCNGKRKTTGGFKWAYIKDF